MAILVNTIDIQARISDLLQQMGAGEEVLIAENGVAVARLLPLLPSPFQPDSLFSVEQQQRLSELMDGWRTARDCNQPFLPNLQAELDELVATEFRAATLRTEVLFGPPL